MMTQGECGDGSAGSMPRLREARTIVPAAADVPGGSRHEDSRILAAALPTALAVALITVGCSDDASEEARASFGGGPDNRRHASGGVFIGPDNVDQLEVAWEIDGIDGQTGTPLPVDGTLYFGDWTGTAHAVDSVTGEEVWASHPAATIFGSPVRVEDLVVVGVAGFEIVLPLQDFTFRGSVVGLDAATGEERWRVHTTEKDETSGAGLSVWSSPAVDVDRGAVYIGTGDTLEPPASPLADGILAIDYRTGEVLWSRQSTQGDVYNNYGTLGADGPDSDVGAAPNVSQGMA